MIWWINVSYLFAAGGDVMSDRELYDNTISFIAQFTMFLYYNRFYEVVPADATENLEQFEYKSSYHLVHVKRASDPLLFIFHCSVMFWSGLLIEPLSHFRSHITGRMCCMCCWNLLQRHWCTLIHCILQLLQFWIGGFQVFGGGTGPTGWGGEGAKSSPSRNEEWW